MVERKQQPTDDRCPSAQPGQPRKQVAAEVELFDDRPQDPIEQEGKKDGKQQDRLCILVRALTKTKEPVRQPGKEPIDASVGRHRYPVIDITAEGMRIYRNSGRLKGYSSPISNSLPLLTKHVHALETGLSSDPPMNWRLSKLDKLTLISNSDCHSPWPWRIGREANVFDLERPSYFEITNSIRMKDLKGLKFTIETDPAYGKYHWTGHRACQVSLSPEEAVKLGNICPVCRKRLTKGVEQRVGELADRPSGFEPQEAVGFMRLLPLSEIIAIVLGVDSPSIQKVWRFYNLLVERFANEYEVLIDAPRNALSAVAGNEIAEAIVSVRQGKAKVLPGYDGVYGQPLLSADQPVKKPLQRRVQQLSIADFIL